MTTTEEQKPVSYSPSFGLCIAILGAAIAYWLVPSSAELLLPPQEATISVSAASSRVDGPTGFSFPLEQTFHLSGREKLSLLGLGTRKKTILNVYSVAFYGSHHVLDAYKHDIKQKGNKKSKCELLMESKGIKAAQLTMNMGLNAETLAEALTNIDGVGKETKDSFGDMILKGVNGKLKKHESMTLEWKFPDRVSVTARGTFIGQVKDKDLYKGLLNAYLGPKSVSPLLKQDIEAYKL